MVVLHRYVLDTSYLLEFFAVEGNSTKEATQAVRDKMAAAQQNNGEFILPMPVLFELANHIADIKNADQRKKLAITLQQAVQSSIESSVPWTITPPGNANTLKDLMLALNAITTEYAAQYAQQKLGLTDTVVIMEAKRLKETYGTSTLKQYLVHIWTRHNTLKSYEPDTEPNPFI